MIMWWMTPLQAFATLGSAVNCGGSVMQSLLTMPSLQLADVPSVYAGKINTWNLHESEHYYPPLNAVCMLINLFLTGVCYLNSSSNGVCARKLPFLGGAFALNVGATAYALTIMVPMNNRLAGVSKNLDANQDDEKSEKELRHIQQKWTKLNYGRASLILSSAIVGLYALLVDGSDVRL